jgi:Domain of Unknown Function (DUF1543)
MHCENPNNNKLFACFVGGRIPTCTIELHDIFFLAGEKIEDTYLSIIDKWWGDSYIHLDSYIDLSLVENYRIEPTTEPQNQEEKLFFINFGGYSPEVFGEIHNYHFLVANSSGEAIKKAKSTLSHLWQTHDMMHLDDNLQIEADDCIDLSQKYHLKLTKVDSFTKPVIVHSNKRLLLNKNDLKYLF